MQSMKTAGARVHARGMALIAALALAGCAAPGGEPQGHAQGVDLPVHWEQVQAQALAATGDAVSRDWWHSFGSAELNALIALAQQQSWDVAAAVARVQQARAYARQAGAGLLPEVTGTMDMGREGRLDSQPHTLGNSFKAGVSVSYEVDFWGRQSATRDAALALLQASTFDRDTVRLTVTAAVAEAWLRSVALRERGAIAQMNLDSAERLLRLVTSRVKLGAASPLELAQQRTLVAGQRRVLAQLQMQQAQTALALLLGQAQSPRSPPQSLFTLQVPTIHQGEPMALVTRRPDIAQAEARLQAAQADLQAARVAMLPRLSLTAQVGAGSNALRNVFDNPLYSLAAGLAAPIFDAGRLAAGRDLAAAQREELLVGYRRAIVQAFGDVQTALHAVAGSASQAEAQGEELAQARKALALAEARYQAGAQTLMELLDSQRSLYQAQDQAVQLRQEQLLASVALYKALGGGWRPEVVAQQ